MQIANRRLAPLAGLGVAVLLLAAGVTGCSNSGDGRNDRSTSVTGGVGSDPVASPSMHTRTPQEVEDQARKTQGGGGGSAGRN